MTYKSKVWFQTGLSVFSCTRDLAVWVPPSVICN
jgi:hypothetical protein